MNVDSTVGPTNVLVRSSADSNSDESCDVLLREEGDALAEVLVSYAGSDETDSVSVRSDREPVERAVVAVGESNSTAVAREWGLDRSRVETVESPTDLQAVGLSVSKFCERWDDEDIVVCFDSLTALLDHVEPDTAFRFVHVLNNRLASAEAVSHYHLDPAAHEDRVVNTFESIFDEVVEQDATAATDDFDDLDDLDDTGSDGTDADHVATYDIELTEASDDDVASLAEEWDDDDFAIVGRDSRREADDEVTDEATDEDVADAFGD